MRRSCVIDNSTLVNLTYLRQFQIVDRLPGIFNHIHVPVKIVAEYEEMMVYAPERKAILNQIRRDNGFMSICTSYDSVALEILRTEKDIDSGEAEAAAQHKSVYANFILSDDARFINAIRKADSSIRVLTTLNIIAFLDLMKFIDRPADVFRVLHKYSPFNVPQLRRAYQQIISELGLSFSKEELNRKSSFKTLKIGRFAN